MREKDKRQRIIRSIVLSGLFLAAVFAAGMILGEKASVTDFSRSNLSPGPGHLFGTDWLGRDMFARALKGMSVSMTIGIAAAAISAGIALVLGIASAVLGKWADTVITFLIDLLMGIPHILLLILISAALGKGLAGVTVGVALTHWPSLARVIRAEVLQLKEKPYIQIARKFGKSNWQITVTHFFPHLFPQFVVGAVLLFPHAILHEASITFLGFGLSDKQPAIGNILSESMQYLMTGQWWLALFPGLLLVAVVVVFYGIGENLRKLTSPGGIYE